MSWWPMAPSRAPRSRANGCFQEPRSTAGWWRVWSCLPSPRRRRPRSSEGATIRCWNGRCARAARGWQACPRGARPACAGSRAGRSRPRRSMSTGSTAMTRRRISMPLQLRDVAGVAARRARLALRPQGAGAQLLLLALLARAGLAFDALALVKPVCPTGADIAQAVRSGRADCGIATRAVAQAAGLDFVPLTWERFDLALHQRDYFRPGLQALFKFVRTAAFRDRAAELAGYDVSEAGDVRALN